MEDGDHLDDGDGTSCCRRNGSRNVVAMDTEAARKHVGVAAETAAMGGGERRIRITRREATTRRRSALGRNGLKIIQI